MFRRGSILRFLLMLCHWVPLLAPFSTLYLDDCRICGTPESCMGSGRAVEDIALRVVFMSKELVLLGNFHWLWLSVYILCMDTFSSEFAGWRGAACLPPVMGADCKLTTMCISIAHFIASMTWLPLSFILMPVYRSLPSAWTDPWLRYVEHHFIPVNSPISPWEYSSHYPRSFRELGNLRLKVGTSP